MSPVRQAEGVDSVAGVDGRVTRIVVEQLHQPSIEIDLDLPYPTSAVGIVERLVGWSFLDIHRRAGDESSPIGQRELARQLAGGRVFGSPETVVASTSQVARDHAVASLRDRTVEMFVDDQRVLDADAPLELADGVVVTLVRLGLIR